MNLPADPGRRRFLKTTLAGGGLTLAFCLPLGGCGRGGDGEPAGAAPFRPNAWLQIEPDGTTTVFLAEAEMGQGVYTSIPMLVAEELDADWQHIRLQRAPLEPEYGAQRTGGSTSVRDGWDTLRQAGATARAMLVAAAAQAWGVPAAQCRTEPGFVIDGAGERRLGYGELAAAAARLPVPQDVALKPPAEFRLLGRPVTRTDLDAKVRGSAVFGIDVQLPGLLVASVARCPYFGGRVKSFDASAAEKIPGVVSVHEIGSGVAVVADGYPAALKGRDALRIVWDFDPASGVDSEDIDAALHAATEGTADREEARQGSPETALEQAPRRLQAEYRLPFQAHATLEPMNCTVRISDGLCEVWAPTQAPTDAHREVEALLLGPLDKLMRKVGRKLSIDMPSDVRIHTTLLGGGFGRRLKQDFVVEAVEIALAAGRPVKLIWSREDDLQHDFYRPATRHRLQAGLDDAGQPLAWRHRIAGPSRGLCVGGARRIPYAIANLLVDYRNVDTPVPVHYWRSVAHSHNGFVIESFIDELAAAAGADPYEYRRALMKDQPRLRRVLELAAEKAGWSGERPEGRYLGIAAHSSYGSHVAQVAEVSVQDGRVRVHRVTCAIDCGQVVNPDTVKAQMEGSVVFGLSAALKDEITLEQSRVRQSNFHDYRLLRFDETPEVETWIVDSDAHPEGVGEPGVPPIAAAVTNAIYAATGVRIRSLPVTTDALRKPA